MATTTADIKLASMAAGFTIGFGLLTVWEAIKQTRRNRNPLRSTYIYMLWGEILANLTIAILGWVFLDGAISSTVPVLFSILFLWVFEVQFLMQIIVNRIAIIAEHRKTIQMLKWGTAVVITLINIAVFCIWIPSHTIPPVSKTFVLINDYWDRISKALILIVDAGLNWYFLRTVKIRLVQQHRLTKYAPLVSFNAKLMLVSIAMDAMLIGLMSLPNQVVYIQFHPVAYLVKLNIEMSMATLITRLARGEGADEFYPSMSHSNHQMHTPNNKNNSHNNNNNNNTNSAPWASQGNGVQLTHRSKVVANESDDDLPASLDGIHRRTDIEVHVETGPKAHDPYKGWDTRGAGEDEFPLTLDAGHPKQLVRIEERERQPSSGSGSC